MERFAARFREHGIRSLTLGRDMAGESVGRFRLPPRVAKAAGGFGAVLAAAGAARVAVNNARFPRW